MRLIYMSNVNQMCCPIIAIQWHCEKWSSSVRAESLHVHYSQFGMAHTFIPHEIFLAIMNLWTQSVICLYLIRIHSKPMEKSGVSFTVHLCSYCLRVSPAMANRMVDSARAVLNNYLPDVYIYTDTVKGAEAGKQVEVSWFFFVIKDRWSLHNDIVIDVSVPTTKLMWRKFSIRV